MNRLKSLFIATYPLFLLVISVTSIYHFRNTGYNSVWFGVLLTTLPMLFFFSKAMIFKNTARTTARFNVVIVLAVVGAVLAIYSHLQQQLLSNNLTLTSPVVLAVIGMILFFLYNYWYSTFGRKTNELLQPGKILPEFPLTDVDGKVVSSNIFSGSSTVLLFFRGNWCPLCMAQIKEIAAKYRELADLGAKVALISPQPESHTSQLASKFDVPMQFFSDLGNQAAKILGIELKSGLPAGMQMLGYDSDTVLPTVIIIDENGTILYNDATDNYRIRPEPEAFIEILQNR